MGQLARRPGRRGERRLAAAALASSVALAGGHGGPAPGASCDAMPAWESGDECGGAGKRQPGLRDECLTEWAAMRDLVPCRRCASIALAREQVRLIRGSSLLVEVSPAVCSAASSQPCRRPAGLAFPCCHRHLAAAAPTQEAHRAFSSFDCCWARGTPPTRRASHEQLQARQHTDRAGMIGAGGGGGLGRRDRTAMWTVERPCAAPAALRPSSIGPACDRAPWNQRGGRR